MLLHQEGMEPWLASAVFYAYVFGICELCRQLLKKTNLADDAKEFLVEVVATVQVCAPIFDVGFVMDHYGLLGVFVEIFFLEVWNVYTLTDSFAHPIVLIESWRQNDITGFQVTAYLLAEIGGAFLSFPLTRLFWYLQLNEDHANKFDEGHECDPDLTVSVFAGFWLEALATFFSHIVELKAAANLKKIDAVINCANSSLITVLGIHLTGMYFNPIVASACTWNCRDVSKTGHLVVYWLGPVAGWFAGNFMDYYVCLPQSLRPVQPQKTE